MLNEYLLKAVVKGNLNEVQALLTQGASINATNTINGNSCLHIAAFYGHLQIVNLLLQQQASVFKTNYANHTPIQLAALSKQGEAVMAIAQARKRSFGDRGGYDYALFIAVFLQQYDEQVIDSLLLAGAKPHFQNVYKQSCLHGAVLRNSPPLISKLIHHGANTQLIDNNNKKPFELAIEKKYWGCARALALHSKTITILKDRLYEEACDGEMESSRNEAGSVFCQLAEAKDLDKMKQLAALNYTTAIFWMANYHQQQMTTVSSSMFVEVNKKSMLFYYQKAASLGSNEAKAYLLTYQPRVNNADEPFHGSSYTGIEQLISSSSKKPQTVLTKKVPTFCIKEKEESQKIEFISRQFFPPQPAFLHHHAEKGAEETCKNCSK